MKEHMARNDFLRVGYIISDHRHNEDTVMHRVTTCRSTTASTYDGGPIILYYNIIIL